LCGDDLCNRINAGREAICSLVVSGRDRTEYLDLVKNSQSDVFLDRCPDQSCAEHFGFSSEELPSQLQKCSRADVYGSQSLQNLIAFDQESGFT